MAISEASRFYLRSQLGNLDYDIERLEKDRDEQKTRLAKTEREIKNLRARRTELRNDLGMK